MVQLNCVACGATEEVTDRAESVRDRKCSKCGQSLVLFRQPGTTLPVAAHTA